ncbi:hypothetical protein HELRODRAFT_162434 [Helobdella robusta]|uniref:WAC domain-containing protein n=1 Tax=Helobdella robusta TaxID=6412 RepID=T1ESN1_HELRO|nr:hypothetical protein HELRODRAFT_162434 [Helobdella robusta]ESN98960.1 hypothetical protein HELRODRAFT_162434 [Helobdella robusta]
MPLLRKEPFIKNSVPQGLKPDDEVFHCPITDEIFTDYEKFFERIILCNSLVWACSVTGRSGLTYQEAAASENHIKEQLLMFPDPLKRPILFLVTLTRRRKINDVLDDISSFMKDRYFVGETVEALASTGNVKKLYKVMKAMIVKEKNVDINGIRPVLSPNKPISSLNLSTSPNKSTSPDKSASQNLLTSSIKSSTVETSSSGPNVADMFEYALQEISNQITSVRVLKGSKLSRKKGSFNRDKCKIFIRDNCYIDSSDSLWKVKEGAIKKYRLNSLSFDVIFTGPPPIFEASESRKNSSKLNGDVIDLTSDEAGSPRKISGAGLKNEESNRIKCAKLQAKKGMFNIKFPLIF